MDSWSETIIDSAGVGISVRDYGGAGPALVLIHGAGLTLASLEGIADNLATDHRVLAYDVRGHGLSDDATFTFDAAVEDLGSVISHFSLTAPAVVGHSLGGMIAALYGVRFDDIGVAVNLDGHGMGVGLDPNDPDEVAFREQTEEFTSKSIGAQMAPIPAAVVEAQLAAQHEPAELPAARLSLTRGLVDQGNEIYRLRVRPETIAEIMQEVNALDLFDTYRSCRCPLLIFNATKRDLAAAVQGGAPEIAELMFERRKILGRSLAAVAAQNSRVEIATVDATHNLIAEMPAAIADAVRTFVANSAPPASA